MDRPPFTRSARAIAISTLLIGALTAGPARGEEIAVQSGEQLIVDLESGGSVDISTWDRERLRVDANFVGPGSEQVSFDLARIDGGVRVRVAAVGNRSLQSVNGRVEIVLPKRFDVRVYTAGGEIRVDGLQGRIEGETLGGQLKLSRLCGDVDLTTKGGNVSLKQSEVGGSLQTFGGNVVLEDVSGSVEAVTLGGNVIYDNGNPATSDCAGRPAGEVKISTHGGNIRVPAAPRGADLQTMGGNITVGEAAGFVRARSMGGNIVIGTLEGSVKATTMSGSIEVTVVGSTDDSEEIRLTSLAGDVSLTIPDGAEPEVDITLAYTKNSSQDYEIRSDFPLDLRRSEGWDYGSGSARKYLYATSAGSGPKVKIETINGQVRLLRGI